MFSRGIILKILWKLWKIKLLL